MNEILKKQKLQTVDKDALKKWIGDMDVGETSSKQKFNTPRSDRLETRGCVRVKKSLFPANLLEKLQTALGNQDLPVSSTSFDQGQELDQMKRENEALQQGKNFVDLFVCVLRFHCFVPFVLE